MGDLRPIRGVIPLGKDLAVAQQHCGMYAQLGGIIGKAPEEPLHYRAGKADGKMMLKAHLEHKKERGVML